MAFDKKLLAIIACPVCKGELILTQLEGDEEQTLVCKFDRLSYEIIDNIPVLLEDKATELSLEQLASVTH